MEYTLDYEKLVSSISIPEINNNCRFWMLRTKEGFFYNEFLTHGFIAIGWNAITKDSLKEKDDQLKLIISKNYPKNQKVPGNALNKCKRFITELQENDIILIVGNNEIAFAKIGEYYEDTNPLWTATKELEIHTQIETKTLLNEEIFCPYKKRRNIQLIRKIPMSAITPILYKVMAANRHSLSEIKEYKDAVLESCYDIFKYKGRLSLVFHVDKKTPINSLDFSEFIYTAANLIPAEVTAKASVQSPGEIILTINNFIDLVETHPQFFVGLWLAIFGGKFKDFEFPSIINLAFKFLNIKKDQKLKDLEIEEKKEDIRSKRIKNDREEIELEKDKKDYKDYLKRFAESADRMDVRSVDNNIVDFANILKSKDNDKTDKNKKD